MDLDSFIILAGKLLHLDSSSLDLNQKLASINWDSLVNMSFIAEIDDVLGMEIDADKLFEAETLGDVYLLVAKA